MNKLRLNSRRAIFKKFGKSLKVEITQPELLSKTRSNNIKAKFIEFKLQTTLARIEKFSTNPVIPFETFYFSLLTKTHLLDSCSVCGSPDRVEMHHIKAIKQGKTINTFTSILSNLLRKQIPLCKVCHTQVHRG